MSLSDRKPMRSCGKRYASAKAARDSKRGRANPAMVPERCACGGWHMRSVKKPRTTAKALARNTGPSALTRAMVYARDNACCAGCGKSVENAPHSVQHRQARGMGGTSRAEANAFCNLVLLCGSATTPGGCHLACEKRGKEMHERGLWLESWERPDLIAVHYAVPEGFAEFWLTDDGALVTRPPAEVAA